MIRSPFRNLAAMFAASFPVAVHAKNVLPVSVHRPVSSGERSETPTVNEVVSPVVSGSRVRFPVIVIAVISAAVLLAHVAPPACLFLAHGRLRSCRRGPATTGRARAVLPRSAAQSSPPPLRPPPHPSPASPTPS